MNRYRLVNYFIATVWLSNGLFCKVLNLVPRHRAIVARILGDEHAALLTTLIGLSEVIMAIWIIIAWWPKLNAITQIIVIVTMNTLEFLLVPDLLLWGKLNALFALLFVIIIFINTFHLNKTRSSP